ncbi:hypothetical protein AZ019_004758 [Klebsiella pneumoniae]|uniref:AAA family ATPase n=1 Tax=Klebsiella pneumoniae TaxID=573 RepID=UPI000A367609|nr:AAA family ATPase [Klebsiella pneumoniae]OUH43798.1 hypothetical protein AZ019_004758 [Klebsiella pneumoniae]
MIKGILNISGLGVYENYTQPAGMQEFGVKNLIYGWNYSGKTTLSRLFAQLESKTSNPDLQGCSFTLATDGDSITQDNFTQSNLIIRVFNSDFIRDTLNFSGQNFRPILLLGKDSEKAQEKLTHYEDLTKRTLARIIALNKEQEELESNFSSAKTTTAAKIKKTLGLIEAYTARHLSSDMQAIIGNNDSQLLDEDKLRDDLKLALTPENDRPLTVTRINLTPSISPLYKEAREVLATTPSLSNTIKHLEENPLIERWVESGLHFHSDQETCEFCGGSLDSERLSALKAHFSKDLAEHKNRVERLHNKINSTLIKLDLPKEAEFNAQFRSRYRASVQPLTNSVGEFNDAVGILASDVQEKIDSPFKSLEPQALPEGLIDAISNAVDNINQVIEDNNKLAANFVTEKKRAVGRVKLHFVQEFINEQNKTGRDLKLKWLGAKIERLVRFESILKNESDIQKAIISQAQLGREEINKRLSSMLGSEAVQIRVVQDNGQERFQLVRKNGRVAKNLSDGEKTAIAFSYFLTKLKELTPQQFSDAIVYIDDPISSLDANHIFQVTAAIREFFFHQVSANGNLEWTTQCKQLFVSTHNFEFLHLLRELKPDGPRQARMYLIKRISENSTTFGNMPNSLAKYASEYHFLFGVIHKFHKAPVKTDHEILMLLPNAVRRFVELYTYSRLPGIYKGTVDQRAEILFGDEKAKRILKVVHFFSHANSIERLAGNNDLIFDLEHAVKDLFDIISVKDPLHWQSLVESVSP